jgi:hypothetical protein
MQRGVTMAGVLLGLVIGLPAGVAFAVARRAWRDLTKTKALLPGMRRDAWGFTRAAAVWMVGVAVVVGALAAWLANGERPNP